MVHLHLVVVQNKKQTQRGSTPSVSHLQKREGCQKAKEDLPLQGNGPLPMWDQNQRTLGLKMFKWIKKFFNQFKPQRVYPDIKSVKPEVVSTVGLTKGDIKKLRKMGKKLDIDN